MVGGGVRIARRDLASASRSVVSRRARGCKGVGLAAWTAGDGGNRYWTFSGTAFPARFQLVMALNPCPCGWPMTHRDGAPATSSPVFQVGFRGRSLDVTVRPLTSAHLPDASAPAGNLVQRLREAGRCKPVKLLPPVAGISLTCNAEVPRKESRQMLPAKRPPSNHRMLDNRTAHGARRRQSAANRVDGGRPRGGKDEVDGVWRRPWECDEEIAMTWTSEKLARRAALTAAEPGGDGETTS